MEFFPFAALLLMPFLVKAQVDISTLSWKTGKRLNIPVSDHSATIGSNGKIYIAGGCISAAGNKYDDFIQVFQCGAITKELYVFEPMANTYVKMQDLPRARYRHAAAWANGRLWLIGGRDLQGNSGGNMILEIDVYDPTKNTWATPFSLSEDQGVSDLGAFANGNDIYIVGGLNKRFAPEKKVWKINGSNLVSLQITSMANLSQARGGIQAYTNGEGFAYVAGGVDSCPRLDSVEKYDIVGDSWSDESPLQNYRSDMALTSFDGRLLAIGGEAAFDDGCNGGDSVTGETTKVVNDVELLNDLGVWEMVPPIPVASFRFGGVYFAGKTYVFGGQVGYNADCQCYKTTDQVLILESSGTPATDAPTVSPDALEPPTFCFSGDSIVEVLKKGFVAMKDLSLGDMVKVAGGKFSEVYSFGHYDQHQMADYLSIDAGLDSKLTLSPDHMVFVENKAVPASLVSVGDKLTLVDGSAVVKSIKEVVRTGAFAPFTKDGTIVVNNVVASSYISLQSDSSQLEIGGVKTFGMHPVAHFFQAPHRIVCELQPSYCTTETYINGISAWVETPLRLFKWLLRQNTLVRGVGLFSAFTLGLVFVVVESLIVNPFLLFCAFAAGVMWTRIAGKKKRKSVAPL